MRSAFTPTFLAVTLALLSIGRHAAASDLSAPTDSVDTLPEIRVDGLRDREATARDAVGLAPLKARSQDSARLLDSLPGVSLRGAGGFSALPAIHGLADDRLRVRNAGVSVPAACPNHMNAPLSYLDVNQADHLQVYGATAPVSLGGDHIGGVIVADPAAPRFAEAGTLLTGGELGASYRSNGNATAAHAMATLASDAVSLRYDGSTARSGDYHAARDFKPAGQAATGRGWLPGDTVGASGYKTENQSLTLAMRGQATQVDVKVDTQHSPYEGFPNQRMDMTGNDAYQIAAHLSARLAWGQLDARLYDQYVRHSMQFGEDKQYRYGSYNGMPMDTASHTQGGSVQAEIPLSDRRTLTLGSELQHNRLDDWWPPVGSFYGTMSPDTFWNIHNGQRDRLDVFGELGQRWNDALDGTFGLRLSTVRMNTGAVQGYNSTTLTSYSTDATAFNALDKQRTDHNLDLGAALHYVPAPGQAYELAYARKTRSPSLYERYSWSSMAMAAVMNNFTGDGNGYVGNPWLKPEVAHAFSLTADWRDPERAAWSLRLAPYYTHVNNYIDAARCGSALCGGSANLNAGTGFVTLQYVNQEAELYGVDLDGKLMLAEHTAYGRFDLSTRVAYTRGKNLTTGDNLYGIMPLNAKLALEQTQGGWSAALELQLVSAKHQVSQVRNEVQTPGYALFALRGRQAWKTFSVDVGIDNLLNRFYVDPLGGAYTGQGRTMSKAGIPWGIGVPGPARTFYAAFNYRL